MGTAREFDMMDIPWPVSILKCNQRLVDMVPGEQLDVILRKDAIKDNLVMLLKQMAGYAFDVGFARGCYRLHVIKRQA